MLKAIALDDEPLALKIIENFAQQLPDLSLEKTFTNQQEALKFLHKFPVDLIFLDIEMPGKDGFGFFQNIPQHTKVIFTTAYSEYAAKAFDISAVDYLVKPFSFERFKAAVEKMKIAAPSQVRHLSIRADYQLHRLNFDDILLVEGLDDYVKIHLRNGKLITARSSLKNIAEKLPPNEFLRVHRSYIVSAKDIRKSSGKNIFVGEFIIPVGETFRDVLKDLL